MKDFVAAGFVAGFFKRWLLWLLLGGEPWFFRLSSTPADDFEFRRDSTLNNERRLLRAAAYQSIYLGRSECYVKVQHIYRILCWFDRQVFLTWVIYPEIRVVQVIAVQPPRLRSMMNETRRRKWKRKKLKRKRPRTEKKSWGNGSSMEWLMIITCSAISFNRMFSLHQLHGSLLTRVWQWTTIASELIGTERL